MRNVLTQALQGLAVSEARTVDDYLRLGFGSQVRLSIFNLLAVQPASLRAADLIGKVVVDVEETAEAITLLFLDGAVLEIDMSPTGHRSPEALMLHQVGQPMVVWERRDLGQPLH